MMQQRIQKRAFLNRRLPLLFKQAGIIIFQFSNNYSYILFTKLPWPGDSEGTFRSSSQAATCPSVYHSMLQQVKNKKRHNTQNTRTTPAYTRKQLVFEKVSAPYYYLC